MPMRHHMRRGLAAVLGKFANFTLILVRTKLLAVYLGPAGIGWIALVNSLNETGAALSGMGVADALNRELARRNARFSPRELVSTGLTITALLTLLAMPVLLLVFLASAPRTQPMAPALAGLAIAAIAAALLRFMMGIYQGLGLARKVFHVLLWAAVANLILSAALLIAGVTQLIFFVALSPLSTAVVAWLGLRAELRDLIDLRAMRALPAWRPILTIGIPVTIGLVLEPLTAFYVRAFTAQRLGETAVGLIQPGLQFVILGGALFNAFIAITLVRWDQSREPAFSRHYMQLLAAGVALPFVGAIAVAVTQDIWPVLIRLLFTEEFVDGSPSVPWFLFGEACRMGGALFYTTFLSRGLGMVTIIPRASCLAVAIILLHLSQTISIITVAQAYAAGFATSFVVTCFCWLILQFRLYRAPIENPAPAVANPSLGEGTDL